MKTEENGLVTFDGERPVVVETVHPLPNLLELGAGGVLESMCRSQKNDFTAMVAEVEEPGSPLHGLFADLRTRVPTDHPFHRIALFRKGALQEIFLDLHDHVMSHPVWLHPLFTFGCSRAASMRSQVGDLRRAVFQPDQEHPSVRGDGDRALPRVGAASLRRAERARFGNHAGRAGAAWSRTNLASAATQLEDYPDLGHLLLSKTHMAMYRQLFEGLDVPPDEQDEAMLPGVADNVLTQRLVASHPAFSPLESLSPRSVWAWNGEVAGVFQPDTRAGSSAWRCARSRR